MAPTSFRHLACLLGLAFASLAVTRSPVGIGAKLGEPPADGAAAPAVAPASHPATQASSLPASRRVVVPLPSSWYGHFKGTLSYSRVGKPSRDMGMELIVAPIPNSPSVSWTVIFEEAGRRRELTYQLDPVPGYPDHHLMDDKNNGLTDQALVKNALVGLFNVPGSIAYSRFERVDAGVQVEISLFQPAPYRESGLPGAPLKSYPLVSIQRGLLAPVENAAGK